MPVDLTSPWIPLGIIMLLGIFMIFQFIQERKVSRALTLAEAAAPVSQPAPESVASAAVPAEAEVSPSAPAPEARTVTPSTETPQKKKMKLRWRTAWIWLPFLVGFFGQAYLSFIKPMLDKAG